MYLSRLRLNPRDPSARRDLASAYDMHRTLARVFAADEASKPVRFLWRLERDGNALHDTTVLVQAAQPGRWDLLRTQDGYLDRLDADKQVVLDILLNPGRHYRFRLLANPTVTRSGKRFGLHGEEALMAWLARQAQRGGFALQEATCSAHGRLSVMQTRAAQRITLDTALFEGRLEAVDLERLKQCLLCGIGPAKALGMGMLSIAPIGPSVDPLTTGRAPTTAETPTA
jgi:CRISPR system Cascade subunit CasE